MKKLIIICITLMACQLTAQHKIGVRAGLNRSIIAGGENQVGEKYDLSGGFHFGINYTYQILPVLGLRAELLYTQRGSKYEYKADSNAYTVIKPLSSSIDQFFELGKKEVIMDYSNGYLSIPITAHFSATKKLELLGGVSFDMLINPTGRGKLDFVSDTRPDEIFLRLSYDHRYRGDTLGEIPFISRRTYPILINGERTELIQTETAYYNLRRDEKVGNKFKFVDFHLILGFNYFLNNGFYVGLRGEYGLLDITNDDMDFDMQSLDSEGAYIRRMDSDKSRSISASFGFRF